MNKVVLSSIGFAATIIGMGLQILSNQVDSKLMDIKIEEKVTEVVAEQLSKRA